MGNQVKKEKIPVVKGIMVGFSQIIKNKFSVSGPFPGAPWSSQGDDSEAHAGKEGD